MSSIDHNDDLEMTYNEEGEKPEAPVGETKLELDGEDSEATAQKEEVTSESKAESEEDKEPAIEIPEIKRDPSTAKPNLRVTKVFDVFTAADPNSKKPPIYLVSKPFEFLRDGKNHESWTALTEEMGADEEMQDFITKFFMGANLANGNSEIPERGFFENWLGDDNAEIVQRVNKPEEEIQIGIRRPNLREPNRRLTGKLARAQIGSILGNGINNTIPLPHTGINVEFVARSDVDLLNLDLQMAEERTKLGHDTAGMIFQCSHFGMSERLFNFAMESITDINLLGWEDPSVELAKLIPITDLPIIYWGMASTMYPNGYPLDLPCAAGPLSCKHIERVNLNVNRIFWLNRSKLTIEQQKTLSKVRHKHTMEELTAYAKQFANVRNHKFEVMVDGVSVGVELGIPSIHEHLEAGRRWAQEAALSVEKILQTEDPDPQRRHAYMQRVINMSALREYSPWVKRINFGDGRYVDDKDVTDIEFALSQLSRSDESIVDQFFTEIQKYIEKATVAIIATPNYSCPKCGVDQATVESEEHPELVPLDIEKLFFELKDRRLVSRG